MGRGNRVGAHWLPARSACGGRAHVDGHAHAELLGSGSVLVVVVAHAAGHGRHEGVVELAAAASGRRLRLGQRDGQGGEMHAQRSPGHHRAERGWRRGAHPRRRGHRGPHLFHGTGRIGCRPAQGATEDPREPAGHAELTAPLMTEGVEEALGPVEDVDDGGVRHSRRGTGRRAFEVEQDHPDLHGSDAVGDGVVDLHDHGGPVVGQTLDDRHLHRGRSRSKPCMAMGSATRMTWSRSCDPEARVQRRW